MQRARKRSTTPCGRCWRGGRESVVGCAGGDAHPQERRRDDMVGLAAHVMRLKAMFDAHVK
jgi:hypothetical protein